MQNANYGHSPPYSYEPPKEEVEFHNCTDTNVQSTVVTIMPEGPPVRDHIIWSTFNFIYMNFCCLGLLAFVFSVKSRDGKLQGNKNAAVSYASTARSLNIAATVLSILFFIVAIIIYTKLIITMAQAHSTKQMYDPRYG